MSLQRTGSANCSLQVIKSESLAFLNKQFSPAHPAAIGSVVLGQKGKEGLGSFLQPVAELGPPELQAGNMKDNLRLAKGGGNHYCVGFGRYALHMSLLKNLLVSPNVFRPKLLLRKDLLYVHMDAGDMLAAEGAKAVCLQARNDVKQLLSHEDLSDLIPLLEAQDALNAFRRLATQRSLAASTSEHNTSRSARVKRNSSNQLGNQENSLNRISDEGRLSQSRRPRNAASQDGQYDSLISPKGVLSDASLSNNEEPALDPPDSSVKRGTLNSLTCIVFVTGSSISNAAVDAALQLVK